MFAPDSPNAPNIAVLTLVCGWIFTGVALLAFSLLLWSRSRSCGFQADDYLTFVALTVAIALVAHTCYAVVDEGLRIRAGEMSMVKRNALVKVRQILQVQSLP